MERKVAIVTGASRGIGKEIALTFAKDGYNLAISCQKNKEDLEKVNEEAKKYGVDTLLYLGDMGKEDSVNEFFDLIEEKYNKVDVLINNVGKAHIGIFQDMTYKEYKSLFETNVDSAFFCSKRFLKKAIQEKMGCIINISSVWGEVGASCEVVYSATKGALNAFTKALAKEVATSNIRVNAISCGIIETDMNNNLTIEEKKEIENQIPIGRMGTAKEIANICKFLAEAPKYLSGQIIRVDGSWI